MTPRWDLISVDDHIIEPRHVWTDRLPAKWHDSGRTSSRRTAARYWVYEERATGPWASTRSRARKVEEYHNDPIRFSDMIPGCYDSGERAADMDRDGIRASLCFPTLPSHLRPDVPRGEGRPSSACCVCRRTTTSTSTSGARPGARTLHPDDHRTALGSDLGYAAEIERGAVTGAKAITFCGEPRQARPAVVPLRPLGSGLARLRGHRDSSCACTSARRASSPARPTTRRSR